MQYSDLPLKRVLRDINNTQFNRLTDSLFKSSNILQLRDFYDHQTIRQVQFKYF